MSERYKEYNDLYGIEPTGWQPIETAPKDGTSILVYEHYTCDNGIEIVYWFECSNSGWDAGDYFVEHPTHWQPLPEPPELNEKD